MRAHEGGLIGVFISMFVLGTQARETTLSQG